MKSKTDQKISLDASKLVGFTKTTNNPNTSSKVQPKVGGKTKLGRKTQSKVGGKRA